MQLSRHVSLALAASFALATSSSAQWSSDAVNTLMLDGGAGDQVQAKLRLAPDGSSYASWYDSDPGGTPAFGYDVRLQRLDPQGHELWAAGGVLIADRGFSSTEDYGLAVATDGDALLAFRDDRFDPTRISAARVEADGTLAWGPSGVQVTNGTSSVFSPRITGTSDGSCVVAWTDGSSVRAQKLRIGGLPQWGAGVDVSSSAGGSGFLADVQGTSDGGVIVSWLRQTGGFLSPRYLYAQKLDASGAPLWGLAAVAVYDGGTLQIGYFPSFVPDGGGGGVFSWYDLGPVGPDQCRVQHVLADGSEAFAHNGVVVSTDTSQVRAGPSASYLPATGETFVFWTELNSSQSQDGLSGQKLDASGARQWGANGIAYIPLGSDQISQVRCVQRGDGAAVAWSQSSGFGSDDVRGLTVDVAGTALHPIAILSSTLAVVDDLDASAGAFGDLQVLWHDDRNGSYDVFGQNLTSGGSLGPAAGVLTRVGAGNLASYTATPPVIGGATVLTVDLTVSTQPAVTVLAYLSPLELPFGPYALLVNIADPAGEILHLPAQGGLQAIYNLNVPPNPNLAGLVLYTQAVHFGPMDLALSDAQDLYLGF